MNEIQLEQAPATPAPKKATTRVYRVNVRTQAEPKEQMPVIGQAFLVRSVSQAAAEKFAVGQFLKVVCGLASADDVQELVGNGVKIKDAA